MSQPVGSVPWVASLTGRCYEGATIVAARRARRARPPPRNASTTSSRMVTDVASGPAPGPVKHSRLFRTVVQADPFVALYTPASGC